MMTENNDDKYTSINSHSTIRVDNYAECCAQKDKYGPHRVSLSRHVCEILARLNIQHGLDAGTLMGAHRSASMLPHDDDFDIWVYSDSINDEHEHMDKAVLLQLLAHRIKPHLDDKSAVRVIATYAYKLEIYRPEHGQYPFRDTNYHNVTCDLTLILPLCGESETLQYQHAELRHRQHSLANLLPTSAIEFEGHVYRAPASPSGYLREMYNYIGPNAYFCKQSKVYKQRPHDAH